MSTQFRAQTWMVGLLSFCQVESALARLNGIASHKRVAFTSRLKHLSKLGIPAGDRPGRGRNASYSFGQVMQMVIAVELLQAGFSPSRAASLIERSWQTLRWTIFTHLWPPEARAAAAEMEHVELYWVANPVSLGDLTDLRSAKQDAILVANGESIMDALEVGNMFSDQGRPWRLVVLNGTEIMKAVVAEAFRQAPWATIEDLRGSLAEEMGDQAARLSLRLEGEPRNSPAYLAACGVTNDDQARELLECFERQRGIVAGRRRERVRTPQRGRA